MDEPTADVVRKAFRARSKICHPDVCKERSAAARFRELKDAKETLLEFLASETTIELEVRLSRDSVFL